MRFLLDTCVISELVRPRPDERVLGWIDAVDEAGLFLSSLTLGELEKGISKLPVSTRRDQLRDWLERDLAERFSTRILPVDATVALAWGRLQGEAEGAGMKLPVIDSLLAATAACHQLTLVTRNVADFARCGVPLLNPWNA
ncbi:type II toxin-antitoxin system VapC family toxin [Trichloromonas acetexigens]|uniref:Ribonuclease VapC n=1 Tax=Trichloromonas acetexigens TaxID=38815 RepID=A0A550J7B5_9BACT|nr:type II toxin-antitoxin system VapC family toxin [Desulfuromonas acetexigens]TRO79124.1 type II toxin-antitoxin system VapC family toxin [Desulfuromonas acetexigens]